MRLPKTMRAAAINQFGPADNITLQTLSLPNIAADEVLIQVKAAGVGSWDATEREGRYDGLFGVPSTFPYVLGWDGAGVVAAVGKEVTGFKIGDRVYAATMPLPKGGFYAQYTSVKAERVAHVPQKMTIEQAAAMPWCALTALSGLDSLAVKPGETIMIFGASGGIGHIAIQLAKRMGAKVFAVAAGADGVALATQLGADAAIDGLQEDIVARAKQFAPGGVDAALVLIGGKAADAALEVVRDGGRASHPDGVWPTPHVKPSIELRVYNGDTSREATNKLNALIESEPFTVHISETFSLEQAAAAHKKLASHFVGKILLRITP